MIVRYLPLILVLAALVLALAPIETAAQPELGPGIRTEMTPVDREAHNGVFDHQKRKPPAAAQKPTVALGDVQPVQSVTADDAAARYVARATPYTTDPPPAPSKPAKATPDSARPKVGAAPLNSSSENKALPPGSDARQVRPAQAFPPDRIETAPEQTPQAPSRAGVDTPNPAPAPKDDPRSVEERADPGD